MKCCSTRTRWRQAQPASTAFSPALGGFTLMEILVSLAIFVLILGVLFSSLSRYGQRQAFSGTVADVKNGLINARQQTLASIDDRNYGVHVSSTAVVFFPGEDFTEGDADNTIIWLPSTVTAVPAFVGGVTTATFTRLTGLPSATGTIVLTHSTLGRTATVTLSASGLVQ